MALKLQVAIKVSQDDSVLISSLKTQAHESKTKEIAAERMALEAAEMITSLTYEINALKRKFKINDNDNKLSSQSQQANRNIYKVADTEVDEMMSSPSPSSKSRSSRLTRRVECVAVPESATPFDEWKMTQYIFSPDTPAASLNHDKSVVEMLLATTTSELRLNDIDRPTINSISKRRTRQGDSFSPQKSSPEELTYAKGTNIYETAKEDFLDTPYMPLFNMLTVGMERDVISPDSFQPTPIAATTSAVMWGGDAVRPNRDNLGRLNIWTSAAVANTSEPVTSSPPKSIRRGTANENSVRFDDRVTVKDTSSKPYSRKGSSSSSSASIII